MSSIGKTVYSIRALADAAVKKNVKKLAAQVQTPATAASTVQAGPVRNAYSSFLESGPMRRRSCPSRMSSRAM